MPEYHEPIRIMTEKESAERLSKRQQFGKLTKAEKDGRLTKLILTEQWREVLYCFEPTALLEEFNSRLNIQLQGWQGGRHYSTVLRFFWRNTEENWRNQAGWMEAFRTAKKIDRTVTKVPFELEHFNDLPDH